MSTVGLLIDHLHSKGVAATPQSLADSWFEAVWHIHDMANPEMRREMFARTLRPAPDYDPDAPCWRDPHRPAE